MPFKRQFKDKYAGSSPENASVVRTQFDLFLCFFLFSTIVPTPLHPFRAYKHIQAHGIPLERDYGRYLGINGVCKPNFTEKYFIESWVNIPSGDLEALKVALFEEGPISVGIDASHPSFAFYNQGVSLTEKRGTMVQNSPM